MAQEQSSLKSNWCVYFFLVWKLSFTSPCTDALYEKCKKGKKYTFNFGNMIFRSIATRDKIFCKLLNFVMPSFILT